MKHCKKCGSQLRLLPDDLINERKLQCDNCGHNEPAKELTQLQTSWAWRDFADIFEENNKKAFGW